jgi:hypothetical protein
MAIKANFPDIKPSLNLDFANTKQLDPRITFTRASTATYYDGKTVAKAEENLLLRSQDYSATWTVTNLTPVTGETAPDGTSTATEFTASAANAVLTQGFTAIAGSYTFSVYLRRVTGTGDIQIAADNGTWNTKVITASWARYDITQTATAGAKTAGIRVVDSGDAIEVWGAQLEQRSSVTAYTPTTTQPITNYIPVLQSAASGEARFDHDPVTGESLGLLVEEQRTNLLQRSEEFDNAYWTKSQSSITANTIVAPDGTLSADLMVLNSGQVGCQAQRSISFTSGVAYTASIFAKSSGFNIIGFTVEANAAVEINLSTGVATTTAQLNGWTVSNASRVDVGNGWYRVSATFTAGTTVTADIRVAEIRQANGNGFSGIFFWGAQLEAGAFPTSYIPTTTATVTRAADAASMTGTNFSSWYRADEGTLYGEAARFANSATFPAIIQVDDGTDSNKLTVEIRNTTGTVFGSNVFNGSTVVGLGSVAVGTSFAKLAFAYKVNDFAFSHNGTSILTDTSGNIPVVSAALIGGRRTSSEVINGTIKKLAYYPARLTNTELQGLTS